jgi:hypothetical protein
MKPQNTITRILAIFFLMAICEIATAQDKKARSYVAPDSGFIRVSRLDMIRLVDERIEQLKQAYLIQTGRLQGKKELYEKEKKDSLDIPISELRQ